MKSVTSLAASKKEDAPYRQLPHNIEAEQALLGAILTNNDAMGQVADFLEAEHFYEPIHQRIFVAIQHSTEKGIIATPVTLKNQFEQDEALADLGGSAYLATIAGMATGIINVKDYGTIIHDHAISRGLIQIGEDVVNTAYAPEEALSATSQIEKAEHALFTLAGDGSVERSFSHLKHALTETINRADTASQNKSAITGIPTGLKDIDRMLGGLQDSDLVILAARPSMGKTALAMSIAINAAESLYNNYKAQEDTIDKKPLGSVGFFSLEMSAEQLASRMLSIKTGINSNNIRRGILKRSKGNDEFETLVKANQNLYQLPFYIDDTPALTIAALRARARRLKRKHNLSLLVIDYLQLLRGVSKTSLANRVQEISEITQGLKAIAKELNIPVLALSQLSRAVEARDDKRPHLSDLRESGSIEQDSDIVMFIYREAYYIEREKPSEGSEGFAEWMEKMNQVNNIADVIVAKHRNGPIGNVSLFFDSGTTGFKDLAKEEYPSDASF